MESPDEWPLERVVSTEPIELRSLRRENAELRRANEEILGLVVGFFGVVDLNGDRAVRPGCCQAGIADANSREG